MFICKLSYMTWLNDVQFLNTEVKCHLPVYMKETIHHINEINCFNKVIYQVTDFPNCVSANRTTPLFYCLLLKVKFYVIFFMTKFLNLK